MSRKSQNPLPIWTDVETTWLAGLLEGEGSFGLVECSSGRGYHYRTPYVSIEMTDHDIIDRVSDLLNKKIVARDRGTWIKYEVIKL